MACRFIGIFILIQPLDTDETVLEKIKGYSNQKGGKNNEENLINNKKRQKIS